jgi:hypothetical protein
MSKPVEIRFTWSKEAALKGSKLYYDWDMKHSSKRYVGWFFVALVQFAIVGALKHHVFGLLYLSTFLLIYWYYIRWYIRKRMIVRYYDQSRIEEKEVLFTLTDEGLSYEDMMADWDHIFKAIKFDDGILLQTLNYTLFFEKDAFKSPKEMDRFVEMMKQHGKLI